MIFCKIKFVFFLLIFIVGEAFAQVKVDEMTLNDSASYGIKKTLPFTSWGQIPFDVLVSVTQDLSTQKKSYQLAKMTAEVLTQKTLLGASELTQKQAQNWLVVRLKALISMGFYNEALALIDALPNMDKTQNILILKADTYLLKDDFENACRLALSNKGKSDYFNRLNLMCLALFDRKDKAMSAFEVWQEQNPKIDTFSYAMNNFFDVPQKKMPPKTNLTVLDTYLMNVLKLPYDTKDLPSAYQKFEKKPISSFRNAVNLEKLVELWTKQNVTQEEQVYKLYLLGVYADLFRGDLKLIRKRVLWKMPMTSQNYSPFVLWLSDKPESQITGGDLLLSLWILSHNNMGADKAMTILNKGGFDMEAFVSEQLN